MLAADQLGIILAPLLGHRLNPWRHSVMTAGVSLTISNFADLKGGITITALSNGVEHGFRPVLMIFRRRKAATRSAYHGTLRRPVWKATTFW